MQNVEIKDESPHCSKHVLPLVVGGLTITCEDNMELMARYPDNYFDLAIVDPQYGIDFSGHDQIIGKKGKDKGFSNKKLYSIKEWDKERPSVLYFDELKRISKNQIIWGGNYFADLLQPTKGWIYWDKKPNGENLTFSDGELAWTSFNKPLKAFSYGWIGFGMVNSGEKKIHPTQKPIQLYKWVLKNYAQEGFKIIDTHLGSGSHAIAVEEMNSFEKMNLTLTACEIDREYFTETKQRIINHTNQQKLF